MILCGDPGMNGASSQEDRGFFCAVVNGYQGVKGAGLSDAIGALDWDELLGRFAEEMLGIGVGTVGFGGAAVTSSLFRGMGVDDVACGMTGVVRVDRIGCGWRGSLGVLAIGRCRDGAGLDGDFGVDHVVRGLVELLNDDMMQAM